MLSTTPKQIPPSFSTKPRNLVGGARRDPLENPHCRCLSDNLWHHETTGLSIQELDDRYVLPTFLAPDQWSPRFGESFFTVQMKEFRKIDRDDIKEYICYSSDINNCGNKNYPAIYYSISVMCGNRSAKTLWRRYSHFSWLYNRMNNSLPLDSQLKKLPPKFLSFPIIGKVFNLSESRCFALCQPKITDGGCTLKNKLDDDEDDYEYSVKTLVGHRDIFEERFERLYSFLVDLLSQPGASNHPALVQFLELNKMEQ
mmetsp:Transcript_4764/g.10055  ORF Transcript_4764/g.10055 Transcript_4764/m.10055 type:complete len:256 (+) Transcript_4764:45-812(+)